MRSWLEKELTKDQTGSLRLTVVRLELLVGLELSVSLNLLVSLKKLSVRGHLARPALSVARDIKVVSVGCKKFKISTANPTYLRPCPRTETFQRREALATDTRPGGWRRLVCVVTTEVVTNGSVTNDMNTHELATLVLLSNFFGRLILASLCCLGQLLRRPVRHQKSAKPILQGL